MKLSLISIERDMIRIEADGAITSSDFSSDGKNPLEQVLGQTWANNKISLNAEKVPFIDSSAIGWLVGSQRTFRENGGQIVLHSLQPNVRQVLDLLKIGRIVKMTDTEDQARQTLNGGAK